MYKVLANSLCGIAEWISGCVGCLVLTVCGQPLELQYNWRWHASFWIVTSHFIKQDIRDPTSRVVKQCVVRFGCKLGSRTQFGLHCTRGCDSILARSYYDQHMSDGLAGACAA